MAQTAAEAQRIAEEYAAAWNGHDVSQVSEFVSESIVVTNPNLPAGEAHGRDASQEWFEEVMAAFPDFEVTVHETLAREDLAMMAVTYSMTHEGSSSGFPRPGRHSKSMRVE